MRPWSVYRPNLFNDSFRDYETLTLQNQPAGSGHDDRQNLVLDSINAVLTGTGREAVGQLAPSLRFVHDLKFDSLDFAELGIRLEKQTGEDPMKDGLPVTVGELMSRLGVGPG